MIKYANTDILDGLKGIKVGLNNIISYVVNTGESHTIDIPVWWTTLEDLLYYSVPNIHVSLDYLYMYTDHSIRLLVLTNDHYLEITKSDSGYTFTKI